MPGWGGVAEKKKAILARLSSQARQGEFFASLGLFLFDRIKKLI